MMKLSKFVALFQSYGFETEVLVANGVINSYVSDNGKYCVFWQNHSEDLITVVVFRSSDKEDLLEACPPEDFRVASALYHGGSCELEDLGIKPINSLYYEVAHWLMVEDWLKTVSQKNW